MIFEHFNRYRASKKDFLVKENEVISYQMASERVAKCIHLLKLNNIGQGKRVLISVSDDYDTACLFLATLISGITAILLDPRYKAQKAQGIINELDFDGWIVDETLVDDWSLPQNKSINLGISGRRKKKLNIISKLLKKNKAENLPDRSLDAHLEPIDASDFKPQIMDEHQVAYILFTSGSSAKPKGVQISYKNLEAHLKTLSEQYELGASAKILNILPIYHTDGLIQGPVLSFFAGATLLRPFDFEIGNIKEVFDGIYKHRVTHFLTVPTMLSMLLKFSTGYEDSFTTGDFKHIISSASILEKELWETFEEKFNVNIANVYGLTETVAGGLFSGPKRETKKIGSIGKPIDCEAKILDENGLEINSSNKVGELALKGDNITSAYLGNISVLTNGWFYTGDLVYKDCEGFYFIFGRKSNIIISGGVNISPEEIQEVLNQHQDILECYVFGRADETWGEKVEAALVLKGHHFDEQALKVFCNEYLEPSKIPSKFHVLDGIPRTLSGKIDKSKLVELINADQNDLVSITLNSIKDTILEIAAAAFNVPNERIDLYASSKSIDGWTSLNHLDFIVKMEHAFKVKFNTSEIMNINCVNDAIELTRAKVN